MTDFEITDANWTGNSSGNELSSGYQPYSCGFALEYPQGTKTLFQLPQGQKQYQNAGDQVKSLVLSGITVPANTPFGICEYRYYDQTGGGAFNLTVNQIVGPAKLAGGDRRTRGTVPSNDLTQPGSANATALGVITQGSSYFSLFGKAVGGTPVVIVVFGDSNGRGSGDNTTNPGLNGQGDYANASAGLVSVSPNPPYVNYGNQGWIEKGLGSRYSMLNLSVSGRTVGSYKQTVSIKQFALVDYCPPTDIIMTVSGNDLSLGRTVAQILADMTDVINGAKARWPSLVRVWLATCLPKANSSNGYIDLAGQYLSGTLPDGSNPTWSGFTDNTQTSGRSLLNYLIRTGTTGLPLIAGYFDPSILVEAPSDERFFRTDVGAASTDGSHIKQQYHTIAAQSIYPVAAWGDNVSITMDSTNYRFDQRNYTFDRT